ncbi:MAG TPA: GspH/FimT family pseudopilin [Steroidobacteraceae bacterium]|nr:GspH/FimT family pseudopilin [Steroidobacteraceae bacterium]
MRDATQGLTLIEFSFVLLVAGLLASAAAPSFGALSRNVVLGRESNALLSALHYARAQAISRGEPVVLCQSADLRQCLVAAGPARGWLVFADRQRGSPVRLDAPDALLQAHELPPRLSLGGSRLALTYWPATLAGTTATLTLCDDRGAPQARAIITSQTGRPRSSRVSAEGGALACPV